MGALAVDGNFQASCARKRRTADGIDGTLLDAHHVLGKANFGFGNLFDQPVRYHGFRALGRFFTRLEERNESALPQVFLCQQDLYCAQQTGSVHVVPAPVHNRSVIAIGILLGASRGKIQSRLLF